MGKDEWDTGCDGDSRGIGDGTECDIGGAWRAASGGGEDRIDRGDRKIGGAPARDEERLVRAASRGDRSAFETLVRRHGKAIVGTLRKIVNDSHRADDIAQEAYLRAIDGISRIGEGVPFRPWMIAIARNIAVDWSRRSRHRREVEVTDPNSLQCTHAVAETPRPYETGPRVWNAVRRLSERDQRLVVLRYGRGLSNVQVARECGVTPEAAKVSLHRTRRRLRRMVGSPRSNE